MTGLRCIVNLCIPPPSSQTTKHPPASTSARCYHQWTVPKVQQRHRQAERPPPPFMNARVQQHHRQTPPSIRKHPQVPAATIKKGYNGPAPCRLHCQWMAMSAHHPFQFPLPSPVVAGQFMFAVFLIYVSDQLPCNFTMYLYFNWELYIYPQLTT